MFLRSPATVAPPADRWFFGGDGGREEVKDKSKTAPSRAGLAAAELPRVESRAVGADLWPWLLDTPERGDKNAVAESPKTPATEEAVAVAYGAGDFGGDAGGGE